MFMNRERKSENREDLVQNERLIKVSDPDFVNDFVVANFPPENSVEKIDQKTLICCEYGCY